MTCSCGGLLGNFSELPFDTREHLITYHTEGRGEDKVKSFFLKIELFIMVCDRNIVFIVQL